MVVQQVQPCIADVDMDIAVVAAEAVVVQGARKIRTMPEKYKIILQIRVKNVWLVLPALDSQHALDAASTERSKPVAHPVCSHNMVAAHVAHTFAEVVDMQHLVDSAGEQMPAVVGQMSMPLVARKNSTQLAGVGLNLIFTSL